MEKRSKSACYLDLKRQILTMSLAPGSDLDEAGLSSDYGLSRTPLREVLQRLSGDGYVEIHANRGAKVASMNVTVMRTFFQTAPMIYANISRLAAENRTGDQLELLREAQSDFAMAIDREDPVAAALGNHTFHEVIGRMAHNPYLMACLDRLLIDHTRLGQTFYRPSSPSEHELVPQAVEQHDAMIAAIDDRDSARAMELTLQHWDLSRDRMERFVQPDPLPIDMTIRKDQAHAL